jgi:hypothetical protein
MNPKMTTGGLGLARAGLRPESSRGTGGLVVGVSVGAVLQMLELERRSCQVRVDSAVGTGFLDLVDGALVHAVTDLQIGEEAAYEILAWVLPSIAISEAPPPLRRTIQQSLTHVLLEAARRDDERLDLRPGEADPWSMLLGADDQAATATDDQLVWSPASMAALEAALHELMALDGACFAAVVDLESATSLVATGALPGVEQTAAAAVPATAGRDALRALRALGTSAYLAALRFVLGGRDGLLRPLAAEPDLAWLLILDPVRVDPERAALLLEEIDLRFAA